MTFETARRYARKYHNKYIYLLSKEDGVRWDWRGKTKKQRQNPDNIICRFYVHSPIVVCDMLLEPDGEWEEDNILSIKEICSDNWIGRMPSRKHVK